MIDTKLLDGKTVGPDDHAPYASAGVVDVQTTEKQGYEWQYRLLPLPV